MSKPPEALKHLNSTRLLILLPHRAIQFCPFQYDTTCMHRTVHLTERQTDPIKLYWQKTNHQRQEEKKQLLLWQYNLQAQHSRIPINLYQCLYLVTRYPVIHCIYLLRDSGVECLVTRIHSAIFCTIEEVDAHVMCYYCSINLASHLKTSLDLTVYSSHCGQMVF